MLHVRAESTRVWISAAEFSRPPADVENHRIFISSFNLTHPRRVYCRGLPRLFPKSIFVYDHDARLSRFQRMVLRALDSSHSPTFQISADPHRPSQAPIHIHRLLNPPASHDPIPNARPDSAPPVRRVRLSWVNITNGSSTAGIGNGTQGRQRRSCGAVQWVFRHIVVDIRNLPSS